MDRAPWMSDAGFAGALRTARLDAEFAVEVRHRCVVAMRLVAALLLIILAGAVAHSFGLLVWQITASTGISIRFHATNGPADIAATVAVVAGLITMASLCVAGLGAIAYMSITGARRGLENALTALVRNLLR